MLRARHLALATDAPDADVAAVLDDCGEAGRRSRRLGSGRGARRAGAPPDASRLVPRRATVARSLRLVRTTPPGSGRAPGRSRPTCWPRRRSARCGPRRSSFSQSSRPSTAPSSCSRRRCVRRRRGPALQSVIHCRLAWATRFTGGVEHARAALELAERLDDDELRARALAVQAVLGWFAGDVGSAARSRSRVARLRAGRRRRAAGAGGDAGDREHARPVLQAGRGCARLLEREHHEWRERDEPRSARALWGLAWVEFWAGRWELAADVRRPCARHLDPVRARGAAGPSSRSRSSPSIEASSSSPATHSQRALELAEEQFALHPPQHLAILGLVALWSGDPAAAAELLAQADRRAAALGWGEPSVRWWSADYVEVAPRARPDRRRRSSARRLGGGRDPARSRVGARARDALPRSRRRRRAETSTGRPHSCQQAVAQHERGRRSVRACPRAARARRRAAGAHDRSARPATRSAAALDGFEQLGAATLGRDGDGPSSAGSAGARARMG